MELFFNNTMRKIRNQYKDLKDMEKDREKWKDIFKELIELPINNPVYMVSTITLPDELYM